jgi:hypothetical protein
MGRKVAQGYRSCTGVQCVQKLCRGTGVLQRCRGTEVVQEYRGTGI